MQHENHDEASKRVKNIAAVLYLLLMLFVVGGTYWHQQQDGAESANASDGSEAVR